MWGKSCSDLKSSHLWERDTLSSFGKGFPKTTLCVWTQASQPCCLGRTDSTSKNLLCLLCNLLTGWTTITYCSQQFWKWNQKEEKTSHVTTPWVKWKECTTEISLKCLKSSLRADVYTLWWVSWYLIYTQWYSFCNWSMCDLQCCVSFWCIAKWWVVYIHTFIMLDTHVYMELDTHIDTYVCMYIYMFSFSFYYSWLQDTEYSSMVYVFYL